FGGRRILVLVAGLGSTSEAGAGIDGLDAASVGYAPHDVVRFSYAGGRAPATVAPDLAAVPAAAYPPGGPHGPVVGSAERLARLLADIEAAAPGVPIDVVGHSLGGVVARVALTSPAAVTTTAATAATAATVAPGRAPHGAGAVRSLVTVASPH